MTDNDGWGGSGIFFAFLIFALFAFGGSNAWGRSDYYKANEAPQYYVDLAFDFLDDKDAPEGKAKRYYVAMHCAE